MSDDYGDYGESQREELERLRREVKELCARIKQLEREAAGPKFTGASEEGF